jgi:hypothetical protein
VPESKIEKPKPEAKEQWALPQSRSARDAPAPPSIGGNPFRPVGTLKATNTTPAPSTTAGSAASSTFEGDASWGTGARTKQMLDSKRTEGMIRRVLGERARKDTLRYDCFVLIPP